MEVGSQAGIPFRSKCGEMIFAFKNLDHDVWTDMLTYEAQRQEGFCRVIDISGTWSYITVSLPATQIELGHSNQSQLLHSRPSMR